VRHVTRHPDGTSLALESGETLTFDRVVIATHADQALRMLTDASDEERNLLGRFRYSNNHAVLHTDVEALPERRTAWASWNCDLVDCADETGPVALTYHINRLQAVGPVTSGPQFCVSLNHATPPGVPVLAEMHYTHPILDRDAVAAQPRLAALNGTRHTYYCGAHLRYGFHEDGVVSALDVVRRCGVEA
jgi:predicted NAD/FAD-binding protein